ncbi:MAG: hypothetical protein GY792_02560 [Gammaproteobacteria bacterium]|nr:hypothetical protein [Gammaproteobacteria bacterium]
MSKKGTGGGSVFRRWLKKFSRRFTDGSESKAQLIELLREAKKHNLSISGIFDSKC